MRTLDKRSISTFSTKMTMFRGVNAPFLSLSLKKVSIYILNKLIKFYLILMIEIVMVMKEKTIESVLHVTSSPMVSMSEKISGRL